MTSAAGVVVRVRAAARAARRYTEQPDIRCDRPRLLARRLQFAIDEVLRPWALRRVKFVRFDSDLVIGVRRDNEVGRAVYKYGVYEFFSASVFKELARPGANVVDAGANIGQYTLLAAKRVGRQGRVLSFEPNPYTFAALETNVAANHFKNVSLFDCALSDTEGSFPLYLSPQDFNTGLASLRPLEAHPSPDVRALAAQAPRIVNVPCRRLDDLLQDKAIDRVDVIKADVEGTELAIFVGGASTIERDRPAILFEVNDLNTDIKTSPSMEWLIEHGYDLLGVEASREGEWWLVKLRKGEDPSRFKDHLQIHKDLTSDPFPDITPNLLALHPASSTHASLAHLIRN